MTTTAGSPRLEAMAQEADANRLAAKTKTTLSHLSPDSQINNWAVSIDRALVGRLLSKPEKGAVGTNGQKGAYLFIAHPDAPTSPLGAFDGARFLSTAEAEKALNA